MLQRLYQMMELRFISVNMCLLKTIQSFYSYLIETLWLVEIFEVGLTIQ